MDIRLNSSSISFNKARILLVAKHDSDVVFLLEGQQRSGKIKYYSQSVPKEEIKLNILYNANIEFSGGTYEVTILHEEQPIVKTDNTKTHPSWGVASLSNVGSGRSKLFGAIAYHGNHYCLSVKQARIYSMRDVSDRDYIDRTGVPIVSVCFSREQLMNLLLGMNSGNGETPCTIEYANGTSIKYEREDFNSLERELDRISKKWKEDNEIVHQCKQNLRHLSNLKPTKEVKDEINKELNKLNGFLNGTMVYEIEQLFDNIEKLMQERRINLDSVEIVSEPNIELIKRLRAATSCTLKQAYETLQQTRWDYDIAHRIITEKE